MHILNIPDQIRYSITPSENGVTLCVWEDNRSAQAHDKNFLFKINQRVSSQEEAQQLLRHYIEGFKAV